MRTVECVGGVVLFNCRVAALLISHLKYRIIEDIYGDLQFHLSYPPSTANDKEFGDFFPFFLELFNSQTFHLQGQ